MLLRSFEAGSNPGLFGLQKAVERLQGDLPHQPQVRLTVFDHSCIKPRIDSLPLRNQSPLTITALRLTDLSIVNIALPTVYGLPFRVDGKLQADYSVQVSLEGKTSGIAIASNTTLKAQAVELHRIASEITSAVLDHGNFPGLEALTDAVASSLIEHRERFVAVIDVDGVRVRTFCRDSKKVTSVKVQDSARKPGSTTTTGPASRLEAAPEPDSSPGLLTEETEGVHTNMQAEATQSKGNVFIALGSNVGDRLTNIEEACQRMNAEPGIQILKTSALYETEPMYVENQESFLNGVCEVSISFVKLPEPEMLIEIDRNLFASARIAGYTPDDRSKAWA